MRLVASPIARVGRPPMQARQVGTGCRAGDHTRAGRLGEALGAHLVLPGLLLR